MHSQRSAVSRSLAAVVIPVILLGACGPKNEPPVPTQTGDEQGNVESLGSQESAEKYAPIVYLHPEETLFPADTAEFIANSKLVFAQDCGDGVTAADYAGAAPPDPYLLAGEPSPSVASSSAPSPGYPLTINTGEDCSSGEQEVQSNQAIPNSAVEATYGLALTSPETFYGVDPTTRPVPAWWQYVANPHGGGAYVYWLFYGGNDFRDRYNNGVRVNVHEADWERVAVQVDKKDQPLGVTFHRHKAPACFVPWSDLEHDGKHPVTYSAKGSHASYPRVGNYGSRWKFYVAYDSARKGKPWNVAKDLRNVDLTAEWYGYRGVWGHPIRSTVVDTGGLASSINDEGAKGVPGPNPDRDLTEDLTQTTCEYKYYFYPDDPSAESSSPGTASESSPPTSSASASTSASSSETQASNADFPIVNATGPIAGNADVGGVYSNEVAVSASIFVIPDGHGGGWLDLGTHGPQSFVCSGSFKISSQSFVAGTVTLTSDLSSATFAPCPQSVTVSYDVAAPADTPTTVTYSDSSGGAGTLTVS